MLVVKNLPANAGDARNVGSIPGLEDPLEEGMAILGILAWRIPRTEEPDGIQSIDCQRLRYDWSDLVHTHLMQHHSLYHGTMGFPSSSADKEFTCNAGDPDSIPGSGRSPKERKGYPFQYSWAFLVVQMVKNPPAMQETGVWSLGVKVPWRRAWQPSCLGNAMDKGTSWATIHGVTKSRAWLSD